MTEENPSKILEGVRVVELAAWTFVPAGGAVLADWGADVLKIENPATGDPQRALISSGVVTAAGTVNHFIEQPNRGKQSVAINVAHPDGLKALYKLVESADVFLTNMLPSVRKKLKVDLEDIRAVNPSIIYARGNGYGPEGDQGDRGAFDLAAYYSRGGLADALAPSDGGYPPMQRPAFGDVVGGFYLASGIVGALFKRERTGEPSVVDVSLLGAAMWQLSPDIVGAGVTGQNIPKFDFSSSPNPGVGIFKTQDGRFITFVLLQADKFWDDFCTRIGRDDLATDERYNSMAGRFQNREACIVELRSAFEAQPLDHWISTFADFEGVWDVVQTALDLHSDPQVAANGYLPRLVDGQGTEFAVVDSPVQFDGRPNAERRAPEHGENTELTLVEAGYTWEELAALKESGAIL